MKDTAIIAAGSRVIGTITAAEDLMVQGRVEGRIQSEAAVVIDTQAIVEGDIVAHHVVVRGIVVGDISAVETIEIASTAQVAGDLKTRRLALRPGGRVAGTVASGVEVQGFGAKTTTRAASWSTAPRSSGPAASPGFGAASSTSAWPADEIVESTIADAETREETRATARRGRKEPSREPI
jgi:cytoskeletal protein CcmA (bactofilin family)